MWPRPESKRTRLLKTPAGKIVGAPQIAPQALEWRDTLQVRVGREIGGVDGADRRGDDEIGRKAVLHQRKSAAAERESATLGSAARGYPAGLLLLQPQLLHAPVQGLAAQTQLAGGASDDAAGARQGTLDLGAIGLALGHHFQRAGRHDQPQVGG